MLKASDSWFDAVSTRNFFFARADIINNVNTQTKAIKWMHWEVLLGSYGSNPVNRIHSHRTLWRQELKLHDYATGRYNNNGCSELIVTIVKPGTSVVQEGWLKRLLVSISDGVDNHLNIDKQPFNDSLKNRLHWDAKKF